MKQYKNILIISGDGRKSGKTTFGCKLISANADKGIIAVKICPHFHDITNMEVIKEQKDYGVYRESRIDSDKDSSLMLAAGAAFVLYVQCNDIWLKEAWKVIDEMLPADRPVICESGGLAGIIKPGLHIVMRGSEQNKKVKYKADVELRLSEMEKILSKVMFQNYEWQQVSVHNARSNRFS